MSHFMFSGCYLILLEVFIIAVGFSDGWLTKSETETRTRLWFRPQSRAIDQSDYRIAGGLFFIDTSFQVSNGVCRWSTANSPYKMATQMSLSAQTDRFRVR